MTTLTERLSRGEESALTECYRILGPRVRRHVARLVPSADVDDIVQAAFWELWRTRERLNADRELGPWLLTIARRRAVDRLRSEAARRRRVLRAAGRPGTSDPCPVVDTVCDVRAALAVLPPRQRQAIALAHYEQLTQREIAERLRIPIGTVKARTASGMRRMRELL
ncbi:RNA polymerase sigma factor [Actinomadura harenae]|uniref:Sigma-70 family RNA polymerase sigma factor n=1 Tax=Actinomadura harenae TaxID=2483351 RepID=A0A3M2MCL1_9ACTN|nr:sigma-70 family RNA polymerase sigma factor [Actinomadura harenae]RMI47269.1 sigma-70 family RNA polymerase sigma factor [Actinomadura harenae]